MRQVLYRAYRPQRFEDVVGQEHIIPILKNQIKTDNLGHAYLFAGPRGTGKTSTARIFAKELNNGSEADIIELDAASHNKVEDIREIVERLTLAPFEGKYKIYILDEVHMLSNAAANAFLKSLEEPPPHVIFIMATTEPNKLPQTILSRAQRFDFAKITPEVIIRKLKEILAEEGIAYDPQVLELIAQKSDGGLRDALSLLDKAIAYGALEMEQVTSALGSSDQDRLLALLRSIVDRDISEMLRLLSDIRLAGIEAKVLLFDLIELLRDVILLHYEVALSNVTAKRATEFISDKNAAYLLEELSKIASQLKFSEKPDIRLLSELVILANTPMTSVEFIRQLSPFIKETVALQNAEIAELRQKLAALEQSMANGAGYPQNAVDKAKNTVDNYNSSTNDKPGTENDFSTAADQPIHPKPDITKEENRKIDEPERKKIAHLQSLLPELKQKLRDIRRLNIYSVLELAKPARYVKGHIFFVFEGENRGMLSVMTSTKPNQYVDPILSELLDEKITTHYVTDKELSEIKEDEWQSLIDEIKEVFPDVELVFES